MKLKEVIPFVDLTNTFVYVPNKLIEQMPKLNKLVNNSGEYYSKAYNPHTKKRDLVIMSLSGKALIPQAMNHLNFSSGLVVKKTCLNAKLNQLNQQ